MTETDKTTEVPVKEFHLVSCADIEVRPMKPYVAPTFTDEEIENMRADVLAMLLACKLAEGTV